MFMGWDQMKVRVGGRLSSVRAPLIVVSLPEALFRGKSGGEVDGK